MLEYYSKLSRASDLKDKGESRRYRFYEIIPGLTAWVTLIVVFYLAFRAPVYAAIFIILFDTYWLLKTVFLSTHLRSSFFKMKKNLKINWLDRLEKVDGWDDVYHLVIFPLYKEKIGTVEDTFEGLVNSNYPKDKMIVVLAREERVEESIEVTKYIEEKYGDKFFKFMVTSHPLVDGEQAGKGSNTTYAAKKAKEEIDRLEIPYENILVSNFDVDTIVYPEYFGILTHTFLNTPNRLRNSYQPIPFYFNNIWQAPKVSRVMGLSGTFWHTLQQSRGDHHLTTFSSHSMPFQALVDVDFWQVNMVSEDSRIFWQCYLQYNGDYKVTPLYYPVSMDAAVADTLLGTVVALYKQQRRWAYGVENVPYFLFGFKKNKEIPKRKKFRRAFTIMEGLHSWSTNALIIFFLGWLPALVGGPVFQSKVIALNLPFLTGIIMGMAMFGLVLSVVLSLMILPPRPQGFSKLRYIEMVLQWALFYVTIIILGAIPALEAQTRLMLGKYMGFWVTPKKKLT
jgi:cellulose synthase/poly-beta-1,6-N-acetylglucosamine synthase-like glycosyltransferase